MTERALRYNDGKVPFELFPMWLHRGETRVWQYGKVKYDSWNWMKGAPGTEQCGCLNRHQWPIQMYDATSGIELDPRWIYDVESWLPHIDHMMCNCVMWRLSLENDRIIKLPGDPAFNRNPAKKKEDIDVGAFMRYMDEQYPDNPPSKRFIKYLVDTYGEGVISSWVKDANGDAQGKFEEILAEK
jgi:hypothetical protein